VSDVNVVPTRAFSGLGMLLALLLVFLPQYAQVRPTNFGGTDEWLYIDLASSGVLSIPYAHRPLVMLWTAPAALLWPDSLWAYYVTHGLWLLFGAWTLALILRRLVPEVPALAFLAAVVCLVWAPEDFLRLDTVLLTGYSGFVLGALLAVLLFLESFLHRSIALFFLAGAIAALTARGFEGTMPLMALAPLLLLWSERRPTRRFWAYSLLWTALMATLSAVIAVDFLGSGGGAYQGSALTLDPNPVRVSARILEQFGFHLLPLFRGPFPSGVWASSVLCALLFLAAHRAFMRRFDTVLGGRERRLLAEAAGVGLLLAALGYLPLMLSASILRAARTQVLSAPGIGLFLAASALLVASLFPWKRGLLAVLLTSIVVAAGAGRLVAMQGEWDAGRSRYPAQHRALTALVTLAPRVVPGTFFLLLDEAEAWPATFPFRHAVHYLYAGEASGQVVGAPDFLYPLYPVAGGFVSAPWPTIRGPWAEPVRFYRYREIVVLRDRGPDGLSLVEEWPAGVLGPLPTDEAYAPRARLLELGTPPPSRRILQTQPGAIALGPRADGP
jgi:hypothetical protein